MFSRHCLITAVVMCLGILTACSDSEGVAAHVNHEPITITQVDWLLEQRGIDSTLASKDQRRAALDELVEQELFAQEADRNAINEQVAIQYAEKNRLARAYAQTLLDSMGDPDPQVVAIYYNAHPALFAERRQYQLQQVAIDGPEELTDQIDQTLESIGSLNELLTWLNERALPYQVGASIKTADELPIDMIGYLQTAVEGEVIKIPRENGIDILQVVSIEDAPLSLEDASADIRKYLRNRSTEAFLKQANAQLRANARIELHGEFSDAAED